MKWIITFLLIGFFALGIMLLPSEEEMIRQDAALEAQTLARIEGYRLNCNSGADGSDCARLAYFYQRGERRHPSDGWVELDLSRAVALYNRGCSLPNGATACYNLGDMYRFGRGVELNYRRAWELYHKACYPLGGSDRFLDAREEGRTVSEARRAIGRSEPACDALRWLGRNCRNAHRLLPDGSHPRGRTPDERAHAERCSTFGGETPLPTHRDGMRRQALPAQGG